MLSKLSSLMLVSLTCGRPPHFTFNRLPLSFTLRHTHFSGQSLWLLSIVSATNKHTLAQQTNNKMRKKLLGIMSYCCCTSVPEAFAQHWCPVFVVVFTLLFDTTTTTTSTKYCFFSSTSQKLNMKKTRKSMESVPAQTTTKEIILKKTHTLIHTLTFAATTNQKIGEKQNCIERKRTLLRILFAYELKLCCDSFLLILFFRRIHSL